MKGYTFPALEHVVGGNAALTHPGVFIIVTTGFRHPQATVEFEVVARNTLEALPRIKWVVVLTKRHREPRSNNLTLPL